MNILMLKKLIQTEYYKLLYKIGLEKRVSDSLFFRTFGRKINWESPKTLDEK